MRMGGAGDGEGDGEAMGSTRVSVVQNAAEEGWEALVLVSSPDVAPPKDLATAVDEHFRLDKAGQEVRLRRDRRATAPVGRRRLDETVLAGWRGKRGAVRGGGWRAPGAGRYRRAGALRRRQVSERSRRWEKRGG